jgi:hypothetical protein
MTTIIKTLLLAVAICAAGCGSNTSIEQSWEPAGSHADLHKVVTVMMSKDVTIRRTAEDDMAQRLRAKGVQAVPGYAVLSDQDYADPTAAKSKLMTQGFDGVVAMRLVSKQHQLEYVPATYGGYWGGAWGGAGYLDTETVVRVETAVYSLRNDALAYSALSKTIDPTDVNELISSVTTTVANAMEQQGVVAAGPPQLGQAPAS